MNTIIITTYTLIGIIFAPDSDEIAKVESTKGMPSIAVCQAKMNERQAIRKLENVEVYFVCMPVTQAVQRKAVTKEKMV